MSKKWDSDYRRFDVVELTDEIVELQKHQIYGKAIIRESTIMTRAGISR